MHNKFKIWIRRTKVTCKYVLHSIQCLPQKACSGGTWTLLLNNVDVNTITSFKGYSHSENYSCQERLHQWTSRSLYISIFRSLLSSVLPICIPILTTRWHKNGITCWSLFFSLSLPSLTLMNRGSQIKWQTTGNAWGLDEDQGSFHVQLDHLKMVGRDRN